MCFPLLLRLDRDLSVTSPRRVDARRRRPAEPEGVKLKSFRRGPRTSGGVSIRPFVSFGWGLINTATRRANGNAAEQLEL